MTVTKSTSYVRPSICPPVWQFVHLSIAATVTKSVKSFVEIHNVASWEVFCAVFVIKIVVLACTRSLCRIFHEEMWKYLRVFIKCSVRPRWGFLRPHNQVNIIHSTPALTPTHLPNTSEYQIEYSHFAFVLVKHVRPFMLPADVGCEYIFRFLYGRFLLLVGFRSCSIRQVQSPQEDLRKLFCIRRRIV